VLFSGFNTSVDCADPPTPVAIPRTPAFMIPIHT
jgi:hypothetical protein